MTIVIIKAVRKQEGSHNELVCCNFAYSDGKLVARLDVHVTNEQDVGVDKYLKQVEFILYNLSLQLHDGFDRYNGRTPQDAYHNGYHISAVYRAADALWVATFSDLNQPPEVSNRRRVGHGYDHRDPLALFGQLKQWNKQNGTQITPEQFRYAVKIAVALHDIGNIAEFLKQDSSGRISIVLHDDGRYKAPGSEERSADIAGELLNFLKIRPGIIKLVKHLILETTYHYSYQHSPHSSAQS